MATARARKREAVADLRAIADEHGVAVNRRSADLSAAAFDALGTAVAAAGGDAERILACYRRFVGQGAQGDGAVPPVAGAADAAPAAIANQGAAPLADDGVLADGGHDHAQEDGPDADVVAEPAAAPPPAAVDALALAPGAFRLRCSSALFTYNSRAFGERDLDQLWASFVAFAQSLPFVERWTSTVERSQNSADLGRRHIHLFLELRAAVDWATLNAVAFEGLRPNASPTRARGPDQRVVKDQGHFYNIWL